MSEPSPADSLLSSTGKAPPFRPPLPAPRAPLPDPLAPVLPSVGEQLDDYELLRELGRGSFGRVFLARQVSLDRLIALKVSANRGNEARTLARLEHTHIVQVFSEQVDSRRNLRLLCMQYVAGTTLERLIEALGSRAPERRDGRAILDILDAEDTGPVALDPTGLREREFLAGCDAIEAACWVGARLAEALAHAHGLGVLHRDVKPANVLVNRYGRPLLADFNVAFTTRDDNMELLGGTLAYMAPEHLEAFAADVPRADAVDERADIYSLGMMLYELFSGQLPPVTVSHGNVRATLSALAEQRRSGPPPLPPETVVPGPVACVLRGCLDPDPHRRPVAAGELARALDGCRELRRIERSMPPAGPLTRALSRWPFALGFLLGLLPHFLASAVNIAYNALQIAGRLTEAQQDAFLRLVLTYNALTYPICLLTVIWLIVPVRHARARLAGAEPPTVEEMAAARRRILTLPGWCVLLSCLGWLPGGLLFPFALDQWSGPVSGAVYGQFLISFTISGLIALTYSFFAVQFLVLRILYPTLWTDVRTVHAVARQELQGTRERLSRFQFLAVLIPLLSAALMVGIGAEEFDSSEYRTFRLLVTALITLGMTGLGMAMVVSRRLNETLAALTGPK